ncbi:flagellar basal-body MS-ring/collar protein FliF [Thauera linaloolentis]|uniref:Flagellar M-ring protein n=1 Tax=Thauera linaloolentis (strain DSM 12138 / JCM 21573 / CCUG 41526 / CIP 105981 / IAM 15112 / NBRC 102519 / 47Lol) TaxID=1123367 RepID=N6YDD2_THAL4|nr:flagellar basal-body MS-ring/collar protein FliF [Thauera linaloolentis]ENO89545.1 flagellar MS-ring protein [Thauera linaloolentis 47Lol = DSM 12138]MCM8565440.1 flagellar M-ring protein FliF [Thauera linaloolentis]
MAAAENTAEMPIGDAPAAEPAAASRLQQALQNINALSQQQKIAAAAAIALAIALVAGLLMWNRPPDYAVLFSNLDERDGGQIISALQQQNVPYRMSPNGNAILVPGAQVHETRLRLAAAGLPKGGLAGFELMDGQKLGISQFNEQVNYQRALEGELSRTVQSIATVDSARVHLAMPKQTAFLRDDQKPTASVMVNLRPGRVLNESQVAGIVHLVSSSVPRMTAEGVKIIDQSGKLLTEQADPLMRAGLNANQLQYVRMVEEGLIERIDNILVPLFGKDNFRAQVTADVDFNQVEQTAETYKPNPSPDQAIRSQQTTEIINPLQGPQGIPGALTNQPPVPATAPLSVPAVGPGQPGTQGVASSNRSAVLNYEVDRNIQHIKQAVGQIKRLSVAVVVNNRSIPGPDGTPARVPLTDEEIARITNVVREAVGYSADRGDTINVANNAFAGDTGDAVLPLWKDPEMVELGREGLNWLLVLIAILFVYFGVLRPLLRTVVPPKEKQDKDAQAASALDGEPGGEDEDGVLVSLSGEEADTYESRLARARELARNDPKTVANLLKEWMGVAEEGRK